MTVYNYKQEKENQDVDIISMEKKIKTAITMRKFNLYPARPEFYVAVDKTLEEQQKEILDKIVLPYLV